MFFFRVGSFPKLTSQEQNIVYMRSMVEGSINLDRNSETRKKSRKKKIFIELPSTKIHGFWETQSRKK